MSKPDSYHEKEFKGYVIKKRVFLLLRTSWFVILRHQLTVRYLFYRMGCYMSVLQTSVRAANFIYCFVPHSLNKFVQLGGKLMCLVTLCTRLRAVESLCISVLYFWCFWSRNSYKLYSHYKAKVCTIQQLPAPKTWEHCSLSFIWLFPRLVLLRTSNKSNRVHQYTRLAESANITSTHLPRRTTGKQIMYVYVEAHLY